MLSGLGGARVLGLVSGLSTDGEALSSDGEAVVHVLAMLRNLLHREPSTRSRRGTGKEETQATDKRGCHVEMVLKEVGCEALLESLAACIARPPCQEVRCPCPCLSPPARPLGRDAVATFRTRGCMHAQRQRGVQVPAALWQRRRGCRH